MGRGPTHRPEDCPWAALAARGLISGATASHYRSGARVPSKDRILLYRALGYDVQVLQIDDAKRIAVCCRWPERREA